MNKLSDAVDFLKDFFQDNALRVNNQKNWNRNFVWTMSQDEIRELTAFFRKSMPEGKGESIFLQRDI